YTHSNISYFSGEPIDQQWALWVKEKYGDGSGYISYWWIKLYYQGAGVDYCGASGGCDEYISNVQVGTINNSSECSNYSDYTAISTDMEIESSYGITVSNGNGYADDRCGIWVDWNQDEDFDDADETIAVNGNPGGGPYTATIIPLAGAASGYSRMRVRIVYDQTPAPCGSAVFGEVEDYTINVIGAGPSTVFIRGHVTTGDGYNLSKVDIVADGGYSTTTELNGFYELEVDAPYTGTIHAEKAYWDFAPSSRDYVSLSSDINDQNFVGDYTAESYPTISGYVKTLAGEPVEDVELYVHICSIGSTMTDANGYYELTVPGFKRPVPSPIDCNVIPFKTDWSFSPPNNVYTDLVFDIADQNYTAQYVGAGCENGWIEKWVARYNGNRYGLYRDWLDDLAVDSLGNIYAVGTSGNEDADSYYSVVKYSPTGEILWSSQFESPSSNSAGAEAAAVDKNGNIYVTGKVDVNDVYGKRSSCVTLRYAPDSNIPNWMAVYDGVNHEGAQGVGIITDAGENVYVICSSWYDEVIGSVLLNYHSDTNVPAWVAQYRTPGAKKDLLVDVALDGQGNIFVIGETRISGIDDDYLTIKYSPDGNELWVKKYNSSSSNSDDARGIAVDESGNAYVTGESSDGSGITSAVTVKYDSDGNVDWVASYTSPVDGVAFAQDIALDGSGNIYVTGSVGTASGGDDCLVIKYHEDSNEPVWVGKYDGPQGGDDGGQGITLDDFGNIYLAGVTNWDWGVSADFLALKYSPDSNQPIWSAIYQGPPGTVQGAEHIVIDSEGDVIVAGYYDAFITVKYEQCCDLSDINCDRTVDCDDLEYLCDEWLMNKVVSDVAPPQGDTHVDFADWAVFASAWLSQPGQLNYRQSCDIVHDGIIDEYDVAVLADEWLKGGLHRLYADIAPVDEPDGVVNFLDYAILCAEWVTQIGP
ncbi:MAG: SBBP repeat-containing protein, partial [Phycisphaerales bacterium]